LASRLGALGDDHVDARVAMADGVLGPAGEGGDEHPGGVRPLDERRRGSAERAGDEPDRMGEGDIEECADGVRCDAQARPRLVGTLGEGWDAVAREDLVDEALLLGRQELADGVLVECVAGVGLQSREQQIDSVRPAAHLLVDPRKVDVEASRGVGDGTEDPEPASVGHRGDDVPAVAEGDDRVLDAERRGHPCLHG
jgi:hypothetical protein